MKIIISILLSLTCVSCDAILDIVPETSRTDASTFYTPDDFMLATNYFYLWLPSLLDANIGIVQRDLDADIATLASSRMSDISESTYGTMPTDSRYSRYYAHLRSINQIFKNSEKIKDKSVINQYLAEAYFFRAYESFNMFVDYGPLIIVKSVLDVTSPELYAPRASRNDFADFIVSDLKAAIELAALPKQSEISGGSQDGRITVGAVNAFLSRVALFEGCWQKYHCNDIDRAMYFFKIAETCARDVMEDKVSYELFYHSEMGPDSYRYMFTLESAAQTNPWNVTKKSNKEYILRKCFSDNLDGNFKYTQNAKTMGTIVASRKMVEMHLDASGLNADYDYKTSYQSFMDGKDPRLSMNIFAPNSMIWDYSSGRKDWNNGLEDQSSMRLKAATDQGYPNRKWNTERTVDPESWGIDVPIIRLAEVYLNYAEAIYEIYGAISDDELDRSINLLRKRVGMSALHNDNIPTGSDMLSEIRRERSVELYLEGFRLNDLKRWATAEKEMSSSFEYIYMGEGSAFLKHRTDNGANIGIPSPLMISDDGYAVKSESSKRLFHKKHYLRPLPTDQLKLNPQLKQNPGWE